MEESGAVAKPTLLTFPVRGSQRTRGIPTTFGRALANSFDISVNSNVMIKPTVPPHEMGGAFLTIALPKLSKVL